MGNLSIRKKKKKNKIIPDQEFCKWRLIKFFIEIFQMPPVIIQPVLAIQTDYFHPSLEKKFGHSGCNTSTENIYRKHHRTKG